MLAWAGIGKLLLSLCFLTKNYESLSQTTEQNSRRLRRAAGRGSHPAARWWLMQDAPVVVRAGRPAVAHAARQGGRQRLPRGGRAARAEHLGGQQRPAAGAGRLGGRQRLPRDDPTTPRASKSVGQKCCGGDFSRTPHRICISKTSLYNMTSGPLGASGA